jgi:hypothetical protein
VKNRQGRIARGVGGGESVLHPATSGTGETISFCHQLKVAIDLNVPVTREVIFNFHFCDSKCRYATDASDVFSFGLHSCNIARNTF